MNIDFVEVAYKDHEEKTGIEKVFRYSEVQELCLIFSKNMYFVDTM
jgi:hypothetical protein